MNTCNLNGKVAVVTGAGRGIGRAIAIGFGKAGASVDACHDYSAATLITIGREEEMIAAMDELTEASIKLSATREAT